MPRVAELPFDSERKCMTIVHNYEGKYLVITKGAVATITAALHSGSKTDAILT